MRTQALPYATALLLGLTFTSILVQPCGAQRIEPLRPVHGTVEIREAPCTSCGIRLERSDLPWSGAEAHGGVSDLGFLPVDSRGRYYHLSYFDFSAVLVFFPDGEFQHAVGQRGSGPGEFQDISYVMVGTKDTLYVFDGADRSFSVFAPDHQLVRKRNSGLPAVVEAAQLTSGVIVANAEVRSADGYGYPMHFIEDDRVTRRVGGLEALVGRSRPEPRALYREIAPLEDGFIAAHQAKFIIDHFDAEGNPLRRFTRAHDDFITVPNSDPHYNYNSLILDVMVESPERVWLLYTTRHPDFERRSEPGMLNGREWTRARSGRSSDLRSWVVEILNLSTGTVLARQKTGQNLAAFVEPGKAVGYEERENGAGHLVLVNLHPTLPGGGNDDQH